MMSDDDPGTIRKKQGHWRGRSNGRIGQGRRELSVHGPSRGGNGILHSWERGIRGLKTFCNAGRREGY